MLFLVAYALFLSSLPLYPTSSFLSHPHPLSSSSSSSSSLLNSSLSPPPLTLFSRVCETSGVRSGVAGSSNCRNKEFSTSSDQVLRELVWFWFRAVQIRNSQLFSQFCSGMCKRSALISIPNKRNPRTQDSQREFACLSAVRRND